MKTFITTLNIIFIIIYRHDIDKNEFFAVKSEVPYMYQLKLEDASGIVVNESVFIRKNWLLTAAHGLRTVKKDQSILINDDRIKITKIIRHPKWNGKYNDLALLQLSDDVNVDLPEFYTGQDELNKIITLYGRGESGTGMDGPIVQDGNLRKATNFIDSVSSGYLYFKFDSPSDKNVTSLEGVSGPGDSGGPAMITLGNKSYLVGISSHQINKEIGLEEGKYGVIDVYTRLSNYHEWISQTIEHHNQIDQNKNWLDRFMSIFQSNDENYTPNPNSKYGLPNTVQGKTATELIDHFIQNDMNSDFMTKTFSSELRKSNDFDNFIKIVSNIFVEPKIKSYDRIESHVFLMTITIQEQDWIFQLDFESDNQNIITGILFKRK